MKRMSETYYRTGFNYKPDHRTYGGDITLFDFEGHHTLASMSDKIRSAESFDKRCCNNIKNYRKIKAYNDNTLQKGNKE